MFPSSTKREIRHFHVVVVQRRQRNVQKSVMHVQSCCFANLNLLLFCRSCCRRRRHCLNSLMLHRGPLVKVQVLNRILASSTEFSGSDAEALPLSPPPVAVKGRFLQ